MKDSKCDGDMTNRSKGEKSEEDKPEKMEAEEDGMQEDEERHEKPKVEGGSCAPDTKHINTVTKDDAKEEAQEKIELATSEGNDEALKSVEKTDEEMCCEKTNNGDKQEKKQDEKQANGENTMMKGKEEEINVNEVEAQVHIDKTGENESNDNITKGIDHFEEKYESKIVNKENKDECKSNNSEKLEDKNGSCSQKDKKCGSALLSLQQMDEAMAKCGSSLTYDNLVSSEPTFTQLLAQSAANPIKWPKDQMLQNRNEHLMYAAEHKKWPVGIDYQSSEQESKSSALPQATSSASSPHTSNSSDPLDSERRKRRQLEAAEAERQRIQALLHPNLQYTLGLNKSSSSAAAAAAAAAALNFPPSFTNASLRSLMEQTDERGKRAQQQLAVDSHALQQLQALQGTLDLTIKPVNPGHNAMDVAASYLSPWGTCWPTLDDPMRMMDKRHLSESPLDSRPQDKKRRKLDEIVFGLSSKGKSPDNFGLPPKDASPVSLRGSSVTLLSSHDKSQVTNTVTTPKLASCISITPTISKRPVDTRVEDSVGASNKLMTTSSNKDGKPGLVRQSDLPPGVTLPPGIELYRPTDAKVDKWLEQHQGLLADSSRTSKDMKRCKIDFTSMDWSQFSGDEHVSVINTTTGHRISGQEAPRLKYLAQWLMEHPNYDVDPQWADIVKDRSSSAGFLSDLHKNLASAEKKHNASRASLISSVPSYLHGSTYSSSTTTSPQSLASGSNTTTTYSSTAGGSTCAFPPSYHSFRGLPFDSKSLLQGLDPKRPFTAAALAGLDPKLLGFDPKLLGSLDPKALGLDPKLLPPLDPKLLAAMGLDLKILGLDTKHHETKHHEKESKASSSRSSDSKSSLFNIDPKLLGFDPKLLAGLDHKTLASLDPKLLASLSGLDPKTLAGLDPRILGGLDPKFLTGHDPKLLAGHDPKLFGGLDPRSLGGLDPKLLGSLDPKLLGGLDPKLFGGLDPKLLGGLDPRLLGGLDPKLLAGLDPKMMYLDPKMLGLDPMMFGGIDPKLLGGLDPKLLGGLDPKALGGLDSKLLASMGMDPSMMMMAGFGGLPGMAGLGMANPLLGGLAGFGIPGLANLNDFPSTSKNKDHRNAASSAANLSFPGMFPGASTAGLMYPPLGLGGLSSFQLPSISSAASTALLNGLPASIMSMAGTSRHMNQASTTISSSSKWKQDQRRTRESREEHRRMERLDPTDEIERGMNIRKEKLKEQTGLSKQELYFLKQMKAERLAREIEARGTHDPYAEARGSHDHYADTRGSHDPYTEARGSHDPYAEARGSHDPYVEARGNHDPYAEARGSHDPYAEARGSHDPYAEARGSHDPYGETRGNHDSYADARGSHDPYAAHLDLSLHWNQESHRSERMQDVPEDLSRESEPAKHVQGGDAQNLSTKETENSEKSGTNSEEEEKS
ncbi:uncharacterized protein [Procambarus clarkii]|uniref:uncharacterized protein n=1 Tax=Procambarus clarkii TaxID=6728 RepID=UPI001E674DAE|nr:uncharacterized protein LOC123775145 [Procambarus clarkii]